MGVPLVQLTNIRKDYRTGEVTTSVLKGISLTINEGEFVAIMGSSGSGKSTLMHIIGVLDLPTAGTYYFGGEDVTTLSDNKLAEIRNREIGFVFQAYHLLGRRSALKNVCLPMHYASVKRHEQEQIAKALLAKVGLGSRENFTPSQLSGGQKQRVAIARSLALKPKLILADEPTGNLASDQGKEIMHLFQDLHAQGHTVVVITHEKQIAAYAKRLVTIQDGQIISDQNRSRS
jgi:putative ABC transport system ATP-binding protein